MVISLKKTIPFVLKAIPIVKLSSKIISDGILNCLTILSQANFYTRAVIADNHRSNISAFQHLLHNYSIHEKRSCIFNPNDTVKHSYLMFDTVHLIKNIRNNLLSSRYFQVPESHLLFDHLPHNFPAGEVHWSCLHSIHSLDNVQSAHLRLAPKIIYSVLHPGNNKQSVPLALAIFEPTTTTALLQYIPNDTVTPAFLKLFHSWWLIVNAKERYHPNPVGSSLISNDDKIVFLRKMNEWLIEWRDSKQLGLTKQTFNALICTNNVIADLCSDLLGVAINLF